MPAASAVARCAASTPSKNRSPGPAGRSSAPVPLCARRPSAACRDPETRSPVLGESHAASHRDTETLVLHDELGQVREKSKTLLFLQILSIPIRSEVLHVNVRLSEILFPDGFLPSYVQPSIA